MDSELYELKDTLKEIRKELQKLNMKFELFYFDYKNNMIQEQEAIKNGNKKTN
jgi:predicted mannosyl-3-phosphoglycerate phosphatase (HAD superfamily)